MALASADVSMSIILDQAAGLYRARDQKPQQDGPQRQERVQPGRHRSDSWRDHEVVSGLIRHDAQLIESPFVMNHQRRRSDEPLDLHAQPQAEARPLHVA